MRYSTLAAFLLLSLLTTPTIAANIVWVGVVDTSWDDADNWLGSVIPGSTDDVFFQIPTLNSDIELDGNQEVNSVTFDSPVDYSISAGLSGSVLTISSGDLVRLSQF